jgi:hypothetical protein
VRVRVRRRALLALPLALLALVPPPAGASSEAPPPAVSWQSHGNPYLFAVGDSILHACGEQFGVGWRSLGYVAVPGATTQTIRDRMSGKPVPAEHRPFQTEPSQAEEMTWFRDAGALVVSLGVNDSKELTPLRFASNVQWFLEQSRGRPLVWVNAHDATDPERVAQVNDVLDTATALHPNLKVLDWQGFATAFPQHTRGDGVHLADTAACQAYTRLLAAAVPGVPGDDRARGYWYGGGRTGGKVVLHGWAAGWTNPRRGTVQVNVRIDGHHAGRWTLSGPENGDPWARAASGRTWGLGMPEWQGLRTVCVDLLDDAGRFSPLGCRAL